MVAGMFMLAPKSKRCKDLDLFKAVVQGYHVDLSENVKREQTMKKEGIDITDEQSLNESALIID